MNIFSIIKTAIEAMLGNKVRTGLTVLGMVVGIASVIVVFSAGDGIEGLVLGQIETFGTDIIETEIKVPSSKKGTKAETQNATALAQGTQITTLTLDDMNDVIDAVPNVVDGYAGIMGQEQVSYGNEIRKAYLFGTNASYIDIDQSEVEFGRFFTDGEDKSLSRVAVLGSEVKEKFFGDSDAIGKFIRIRKTKYRIIGVMHERGSIMTMNFDDFVYIPVRTMQKRILGIDHVVYFIHKVRDLSIAEDTAGQIREIIRENHDITDPDKEDFRVVTMTEMMDMLSIATDALTILLLAIVAISLIVGGVGIMNIMYVVVSERTKEIGLRKAVGARYSDIMGQFLAESVIITFAGGLFGILIGVLISITIYFGANQYGLDWRFSIPLKAYVIAIVFSVIFGIGFGLYPARKAAKLDPIDALRK